MSAEIDDLRPHLRAHDCEWLIDAGADLEICRDAIVYLDAKEQGNAMAPPAIEAVVTIDRAGGVRSQPVMIGGDPIAIRLDGRVSGFRILRLDGEETRLFDEAEKTALQVVLRRGADGRIAVAGIEELETFAIRPPQVNLLPAREGRPRFAIEGWFRRLFR